MTTALHPGGKQFLKRMEEKPVIRLGNLRAISLDSCGTLLRTPGGVQCLMSLRQLEWLSLKYCTLPKDLPRQESRTWGGGDHLRIRQLSLAGDHLTDDGFAGLGALPRLEKLWLKRLQSNHRCWLYPFEWELDAAEASECEILRNLF